MPDVALKGIAVLGQGEIMPLHFLPNRHICNFFFFKNRHICNLCAFKHIFWPRVTIFEVAYFFADSFACKFELKHLALPSVNWFNKTSANYEFWPTRNACVFYCTLHILYFQVKITRLVLVFKCK